MRAIWQHSRTISNCIRYESLCFTSRASRPSAFPGSHALHNTTRDWPPLSLIYRRHHHVDVLGSDEPTIYALSTASGTAAIAVIRISGTACRKVYHGLCPDKPLPPARQAVLRRLYVPHQPPSTTTLLDSGALVLYFPAPRTATGEDVLELHVHGGVAVVKAVLAAIPQCVVRQKLEIGTSVHSIRYAEAGEFTRRAFANNRMDLPQIESLGATLSATTEQQRKLSVRGTNSRLATRYEGWRVMLLQARGELEALIDFSEDQHFDESPSILCASVAKQVQGLVTLINAHIANAVRGELLRNGISIALLGSPNAGKSSLLNRIVGRDTAIVSQEAGTTRDIVEVGIDLAGWLVRIGDMAGLRKAGILDAIAVGLVEQEGIKRAKQRALESDVLVIVQDATAELFPEVLDTARQCRNLGVEIIVAVNKFDKIHAKEAVRKDWIALLQKELEAPLDRIHFTSCKADEVSNTLSSDGTDHMSSFLQGLVTTFESMTKALAPDAEPDQSIWQESLGASERQRKLLVECLSHLSDFLEAVQTAPLPSPNPPSESSENGQDIDVVMAAESLRLAADTLARITGRGDSGDVDEVLGVVFEK